MIQKSRSGRCEIQGSKWLFLGSEVPFARCRSVFSRGTEVSWRGPKRLFQKGRRVQSRPKCKRPKWWDRSVQNSGQLTQIEFHSPRFSDNSSNYLGVLNILPTTTSVLMGHFGPFWKIHFGPSPWDLVSSWKDTSALLKHISAPRKMTLQPLILRSLHNVLSKRTFSS